MFATDEQGKEQMRIRRNNSLGLFLTSLVGTFLLSACAPETQEVMQSSPEPTVESWELLQESYLAEIEESAPSNFANESAALSYLKLYCEIDMFGDAGEADVVDRIASKYCNTDLADELGVEEPKVALVEVDEEEFTRIAGEKYGVYAETYEDGSSNTPVSLAKYICENGDILEMEAYAKEYGFVLQEQFNWFAMETFCPQKLG